jgi:hypothetical protein
MSELNPHESDLVLGGQNPPPITAAVLGGLAGIEQQLLSKSTIVRLQALNNITRYGKDAIDLLIQSLADPAEEVRQLTNKLLDDLLDTAQKNEVFRVLASDADSNPQLLIEIARSNDLRTVKNLAINSNTPPDVLINLGNISNMDAMLAANIQEWSKLKQKAKLNPFGYGAVNLEAHYQKLANSGISIEIIDTVKIACEIYRDITRHPNSPIELLLNLGCLFPNDFINNPILTQLILENHKFIDDNYYTQIAVAEHPDTPVEILQYLLKFGRYGVRKNIAVNPNVSLEMLEEMANYAIEHPMSLDETLIGIAKNPNTPVRVLKKIAMYREQIIIDPVWFREDTRQIKNELGLAISENPNLSD